MTFTLGPGKSVAFNESVEVTVPAASLIRLPTEGIRENSSNFTISSEAATGHVYSAVISSPAPIGAFFNVALEFSPKVAGALASLILKFEPQMPLAAGETINLFLDPLLTGAEAPCIPSASSPLGFFGPVSWNASESRLLFTTLVAILPGESISIVVPSVAGIRLPEQGVLQGSTFGFSTAAAGGAIPHTALDDFTLVGGLSASMMRIDLEKNGGVHAVAISFTATFPLLSGDVST